MTVSYFCTTCGEYHTGGDCPNTRRYYTGMVQTTNIQVGWLCPRCDKINSPWQYQCNCKSKEQETITTTTINDRVTTSATNINPDDYVTYTAINWFARQ